MPESIIFQIDKEGKRIGETKWTGYIRREAEDFLVVHITDKKGQTVQLKKGDMIHFNHFDVTLDAEFEIEEVIQPGFYKIKSINS